MIEHTAARSPSCLHFTTNPGLEDIVVTEWQTRLQRNGLAEAAIELHPHGLDGFVQIQHQAPMETLWPLAQQMRSIHHVLRPVSYFDLPDSDPLDYVYAQLTGFDIPEMEAAESFRVTSKRSGRHTFTSIDVQKVAGAALVERYNRRVNLTAYDANIRVDILGNHCYVAVQRTHRPLDLRFDYAYRPRVALKTNVCFALLCLAHLHPDGIPAPHEASATPAGAGSDALRILDPFCGSGTVVLEGAATLPTAHFFASDAFESPVQWTADNVAANGYTDRIDVQQLDARFIQKKFEPDSLHAIITNPPFGSFLGANTNFHSLYQDFLQAAWTVLAPGGYLALLVWKRPVFNRVVSTTDFSIRHVRIVDVGGIFPGVFILQKSVSHQS